jgi:DNA-binding MarR family transcriptional regulator
MPNHNDLLVALRQITRAIDLNSKQLSKTTGMTAPQLLILQALHDEGGIGKPSNIARLVHLSQATVTSIVDRLTRAKLVERKRNDDDRRSINIILTEAGSKKLRDAPEPLRDSLLKAFSALEQWEQTALISSVQRIALMMNAEKLDAAPILEVGVLTDASTLP